MTATRASKRMKHSDSRESARVLGADVIAKPLTDRRNYRLVELRNGLRSLLVHDPAMSRGDEEEAEMFAEQGEGRVGPEGEGAHSVGKHEGQGEGEQGEEEGSEGDEEEEGEEDDNDNDSSHSPTKDSGSHKAACALCLGVGFLCDPPGLDGLAHFAEHMVFMGTAKYPGENEWSEFLAQRGGEDNGETDAETTVFYFDCQPSALREALDRFCAFFAEPLFSWDSAGREVKAIQSEFEQACQRDSTRRAQLLCHLADEGHPHRRFGWGNRRSLEHRPTAAGVDMRAALKDFHAAHYAPCLMTLVVIGAEPLDTLQAWAVESAGAIKGPHVPRPNFGDAGPPVQQGRLPLLVHIAPLKKRRTLELVWWLPSMLEHQRSKPWDYLSHLIGHEGRGSILAALKARSLATALRAGTDQGDEHTTAAMQFTVTLTLTDQGLADVDAVICCCLAYVGMLARTPPEAWVYDEMRDAAALGFRFAEGEAELEYARRLAISLQLSLPPEESLCADAVYAKFDPDLIADLARRLTPEGLTVMLSAEEIVPAPGRVPGTEGVLDGKGGRDRGAEDTAGAAPVAGEGAAVEVEPWFGTRYVRRRVALERVAAWRAAYEHREAPPGHEHASLVVEMTRSLQLPARNPYIPTDFSLRSLPALASAVADSSTCATTKTNMGPSTKSPPAVGGEKEEREGRDAGPGPDGGKERATHSRILPSPLLADERGCLFHCTDTRFFVPKAVFCAEVAFAGGGTGAREALLSSLATGVAMELLVEDSYAASIAGLRCSLVPSARGGLVLEVEGFSQRLPNLARRVVSAYASLAQGVDESVFSRVRQGVHLHLSNTGFEVDVHSDRERLRCIERRFHTADALLAELPGLDAEAVRQFVEAQLVGGTQLRAYAGGNMSPSDAVSLWDEVHTALGEPPGVNEKAVEAHANACVRLPPGARLWTTTGRNPADRNCALEIYWQLGDVSPDLAARTSLLEHCMYEPLFDSLRTKQQLGYTVGCMARATHGVLGFTVSLVSATHTPTALEAAVATFLRRFCESLANMPAQAWAGHVEGAVSNKLQDDHSVIEEAGRYFPELETRQYIFDRAQQEAGCMRALTQSDFAAWAHDHLLPGGRAFRAVCVHVLAPAGETDMHQGPEAATEAQTLSTVAVLSPEEFKVGLDVIPSPVLPLPPMGDAQ